MEHGRTREGKSLRVLIAATFGQTAANCLAKGCPENQRLRDRFGCDGPTGSYGIDCTCGGSSTCRRCRGTGQERVRRCPAWHVRQIPGLERFLVLWRRVKRYGALPMAGGIMAQANVYLEAADVVEAATARAVERATRKE